MNRSTNESKSFRGKFPSSFRIPGESPHNLCAELGQQPTWLPNPVHQRAFKPQQGFKFAFPRVRLASKFLDLAIKTG